MDYCIDTYLLDENIINKSIEILQKNNCKYYLDDGYNETTNKKDCIKVVGVFDNITQGEKIVNELQKEKINCYLSTEHINIIDNSINKLNSLKRLFNIEKLDYNALYVVGNDVNDYEMLKYFKGAIMKNHNYKLDDLNKDEYETLYNYIEELSKN